jgi:Flp pilus assembly protein TadD
MPLLLALIAFLVYRPSLQSGFVYDARVEIVGEGFITSLSNLPAVLSLKVLGMNLMLADRPGQLLFLMLNASLWGTEPWGYHLTSNLLHAANVALLFVLLLRLLATELRGVELTEPETLKVQLAAITVTLIFALHPLAAEAVSSVNYSSDLLVTFFTLLALLAAIAFRPDDLRSSLSMGGAGVFCALASVTCKESGMATALLLIVYWFLYRRGEAKLPWLLFLGAAAAVTAIFLAARFISALPPEQPLKYLGGSFSKVFWIQPRLWVFMMGKLFWPTGLSADYTLENVAGISTRFALLVLAVVISFQVWLAAKSRIGALGVAFYWLGLATVSNLVPLHRILADRFYYLPLAGVAMQLLVLLLMTLKSRPAFWTVIDLCLVAILPLTVLTLLRENVFADEYTLWSDTIQVSPYSSTAHADLGAALLKLGRTYEATVQLQKALEISPREPNTHNDLGIAFGQSGQLDDAIAQFKQALEVRPDLVEARNNLAIALLQKGDLDESIVQSREAIKLRPRSASAHNNLGNALLQEGQVEQAIEQFHESLRINPNDQHAQDSLAKAMAERTPPSQ